MNLCSFQWCYSFVNPVLLLPFPFFDLALDLLTMGGWSTSTPLVCPLTLTIPCTTSSGIRHTTIYILILQFFALSNGATHLLIQRFFWHLHFSTLLQTCWPWMVGATCLHWLAHQLWSFLVQHPVAFDTSQYTRLFYNSLLFPTVPSICESDIIFDTFIFWPHSSQTSWPCMVQESCAISPLANFCSSSAWHLTAIDT